MTSPSSSRVYSDALHSCLFCSRFQIQSLDSPVQQLGYVELVFRRTGDFVDPSELLELFSGLSQIAEHFPSKLSSTRDRFDAATYRKLCAAVALVESRVKDGKASRSTSQAGGKKR